MGEVMGRNNKRFDEIKGVSFSRRRFIRQQLLIEDIHLYRSFLTITTVVLGQDVVLYLVTYFGGRRLPYPFFARSARTHTVTSARYK